MKKIFTLITVALMAMSASAQEIALFENGGTYNNGAELSTANAKVVLGNDRTSKPYDVKLSGCKAYTSQYFGQTVQVQNEDTGEMEDKTRVVYVVGNQNPKDKELEGDKSAGSGYKPESGNLPQSGTYYMFTPTKNGHVCAFIILNYDKSFYVVKGSDGQALAASEMVLKADGDEPTVVELDADNKVTEKLTGTVEFDVVANETYYIFCTGSKLSFGGYVFAAEGGEEPQNLTETTLWEGTAVVDGWANQPGFLTDGGAELQAVNAKAGDIIRFYMTAPDNEWEVELTEGHWGGMYVRWAAYDHGGTNQDGSVREYTVVDLAGKGYAEYVMTEDAITKAYTQQYWGNVFLLNGTGNLTVSKITILQEGGTTPEPQPEGEKVSIIDKFTGNWNGEETNTHNADGTVTYNGKQWGGLSAWLCDEAENPSDWSAYTKLVFEFAEATPAACQGFIQTANEDIKTWGNAGITKLECPFDDKDMSQVKQAALQAAEDATYQISAIYLVKNANGIEETVALTRNANAPLYNLAGVRVSKDYKGIVIQNGRKFIQK